MAPEQAARTEARVREHGEQEGEEGEDLPSSIAELIEIDVHRTFATCSEFVEGGGPDKLRRVLRRFAATNPDIGYCQALNFVAAVFVMVLRDEGGVPRAMVRLISKLGARRWYTEEMRQLRADALVLQDLIRERLPVVHGAFRAHGFKPLFVCPRWFLSLFATALEGEDLLRIWDVVLCDGVEAVFRIAIALLAWRQEEILRAASLEDLLGIFLVPQGDVAAERLLAMAYLPKLLGPFSPSDLAQRRCEAASRVSDDDGASPGGAVAAARAMAPYLFAYYTRDLMAAGREARGGASGEAFHVGDLTRGLVSRAREVKEGASGYRFGDLTRGLTRGLVSRLGSGGWGSTEPEAADAGGATPVRATAVAAEGQRLVGTWRYGSGERESTFKISFTVDGEFQLEERLKSGTALSGLLQRRESDGGDGGGAWYVAEMGFDGVVGLGAIRLRRRADAFGLEEDAITLSFLLAGGTEWGEDAVAHRVAT